MQQGNNATYDVILSQMNNAEDEFSRAFSIVPNAGYQRQSFSINVINTSLIDFEDLQWQNFSVLVSFFSFKVVYLLNILSF